MKEKEPLISIIILNYNAGNLLLECVESIYNSNYKNFEIIVVDNVSKDNSHKKCKEKFGVFAGLHHKSGLGSTSNLDVQANVYHRLLNLDSCTPLPGSRAANINRDRLQQSGSFTIGWADLS